MDADASSPSFVIPFYKTFSHAEEETSDRFPQWTSLAAGHHHRHLKKQCPFLRTPWFLVGLGLAGE